jgi:hypothetical protein
MSKKYGLIWATSPYCFQTLERKLRQQSEKGWMIDKVGTLFARYKSCEPKKRSVQVIYDPDAVEYDVERSPYSQGLEEYISEAGWVKACDYFKQKIYYNEDPDAVPIETDDRLKLQSIKDSMRPTNLFGFVVIFLFAIFFGVFGDAVAGTFSSPGYLTFKAGFLAMALLPTYFLVSYVRYALWVHNSEVSLEAGGGLADGNGALILDWIMVAASLVLLLVFIIGSVQETGDTDEGMKMVIDFVTFFFILSIGRNLAIFLRDKLRGQGKKTGSWVVILFMFVIFLLLFTLRSFLLG